MKSSDDILVSVVIPTYSRNEMLGRAIDSIINQTHQNLEIIVVDDNPAESEYRASAEAIMKEYESDNRIHYIQNEHNLGGSGARNVGIEASHGDYIAFLDDDDEYLPTKIEKQLNKFLTSKDDKLALVYCDVVHVGIEGNIDCTVKRRRKGNCIYEAIKDDCIAATSQWLVKKEFLNDVGNFSIVPCKQDSTVILKLLVKGYTVDYVPEILSKYYNYQDTNRISFSSKRAEGELLYYEACRNAKNVLSSRKQRKIDYILDSRLYQLYSRKVSFSEEKRNDAYQRMVNSRPIFTRFELKRKKYVRNVKTRIKRFINK